MSFVIKQGTFSVKKSDGTYENFNTVGEKKTSEMISEIEAAGSTQKQSVESAGATQKTAIANAGTTEIGKIQAKGIATLSSIPDDYTALSNEVLKQKADLNVIHDYYFKDGWLETRIADIEEQAKIDKGISFVFVTDLHFRDNQLQSKYLIREILEKTHVPFVICGGDFVHAYTDDVYHNSAVAECMDSANELIIYKEHIGNERFFSVRGNRDFTVKYKGGKTDAFNGTGVTLDTSYTHKVICGSQNEWVTGYNAEHGCWYIDDAVQKIRIIGINSEDNSIATKITNGHYVAGRITQAQVEWILNTALNCTDRGIVFVSHIPTDSSLSGYEAGQEVIHQLEKAINAKSNWSYTWNVTTSQVGNVSKDFTGTTNEVICHICGHNHNDESHVSDGVLTVSTTSDAGYTDGGIDRKAGTVNEQAFDIFTINTDSRNINTYRVGGGYNREWSY